MKKKALIVVTSHERGYYLPEVTHPFLEFHAAGIEADFLSPKGGKAPMDPSSLDPEDAGSRAFLSDSEWSGRLERTLSPEQIRSSDYSVIFFAGGHGTMWDFPENPAIARIAAEIYERGGVVAAVCHGPAALVNLKLSDGKYLVDGKKITAFSNDEEDAAELSAEMPFLLETMLVKRGAVYTKAPLWEEHVIVDGRLVTGQNPASAEDVGRQAARIVQETVA